jgi:hypothetical protein
LSLRFQKLLAFFDVSDQSAKRTGYALDSRSHSDVVVADEVAEPF